MATRVLSTVVLWCVVFAALWFFGAKGVVALVAIVAALTLREFYRLQAAAGSAPFAKLGILFGTLIAAAPWLEGRFGLPAGGLLPLAIIVFSIRILGERTPETRVPSLASTLFGLIYVGLLLQYLVRIALPRPGDAVPPAGRVLLCVWVVAVAKFCDTGALLSGLLAGRRLLAPQISPKKTWEGAAGGVIAAAIVGAAFAWFARPWMGPALSPLRAALLSVPIAVAAIISDLVESIIKREAGIKDSGGGIPGIGGVFDVTDSVLLAAPVGYFLLGLK